jgi:hypothetical protein
MTVIITKPENRLAKMIHSPSGGVTVSRALIVAASNLDAIRDAGIEEIDALLRKMSAVLEAGADLPEAPELYKMSNLVVGYAGAFGLEELSQAAYSLCDALDGMITTGRWRRARVEVHLAAMGKLRQVSGNHEICKAIIDGLRQVAAQSAQD